MFTKELQYIDDNGQNRTVVLENTKSQLTGGWTNPNFIILEQGNESVEYFTYLGGDMGKWQTMVHCNSSHPPLGGGVPDVVFESRHPGGHSKPGETFQVRNHQNTVVTITGLRFQLARPNDSNEYEIFFYIS